jgi:hypothetical protein
MTLQAYSVRARWPRTRDESKGWDGKDFQPVLLKEQAVAAETRGWESQGVKEIRGSRLQTVPNHLLAGIKA